MKIGQHMTSQWRFQTWSDSKSGFSVKIDQNWKKNYFFRYKSSKYTCDRMIYRISSRCSDCQPCQQCCLLRWNDERGSKLGLLYRHTPHTANAASLTANSTPHGNKLDGADGKPDAVDGKFDGFGRISTHFYGVTERSCIFSVTSDLTHWPNMDLWRHVYYAQLITYSW